jgi:hypothetical protein
MTYLTYRRYYWNKFKEQFWITWKILWHGVILDQGHHNSWGKGWFYGKRK